MSWFKRTFKKVKNTAGDLGKHLVNTVTAPVAVLTKGDLIYSGSKFKSKNWGKAWDTVKKPLKWTTGAGLALAGGIAAKGALDKSKSASATGDVKKTLTSTTSSLTKTLTGEQSKTGLKGLLQGMPSLSDVLSGAVSGVKDSFSSSEAGEKMKEDAARDWLEENWKTGALIGSGVLVSILTFLNLRK